MQFNLMFAGSSVVVLVMIVIGFFYQRYLKHKNHSLVMLSKRPDWVEPSINGQHEELLEENIAEEIISSILPPARQPARTLRETSIKDDDELLTLYIMAAPNRPFQGYELLQAISVNGFSYGKMRIFHRHEEKDNLNSPVLFSLANALEPGFFNLSEMGSFSCTGLILFMRLSPSDNDLVEQFYLMLDAAYQLADDLSGEVLDTERNLFDEISEKQYLKRLGATPAVT